MNQRWNAASFFVKQGRYQQVAAARAAGNIALVELADRPMLPPGTTKNYQATVSGPVYIPKPIDRPNSYFSFSDFRS